MRNSASTAVAPWKAYQGITLAPNTEDLPRNTSAIMERIQTAETSQTSPAATHHNIAPSRPFPAAASCRRRKSIPFHG